MIGAVPSWSTRPGLVSVVMPAYNAAAVIGEAISSVIAQTYGHWELIITDDGSTDATAAIVRGFDDPRIRLIRQSNQGVSAARNSALDVAQGEFITFLDADDALPPNSLKSRVLLLQCNPGIDVVDGVFIVCGFNLSVELQRRYPGSSGLLLPRLLMLDEKVFRNGCFLFRRLLLGRTRFQYGLTHAEDLLFFMELAAAQRPVYAPVNEVTYLYRTSTTSAMANLNGWEQGYFHLLKRLHRIPQLSWYQCVPTHLRIARILLATWLRRNQPIRALISASRALMLALIPE